MIDPIRLKRLSFRSWHRGTKETDLILGNYTDAMLASMDDQALTLYEQLLEEQDAEIWDWLTDKEPPPKHYAALIETLKEYGKREW